MIGTPPATLPSNPKRTPARSAAWNTSCPWTASKALLAVTTSLPAAIAPSTRLLAGSIPPMSSTTMPIAGSAIRRRESVVTGNRFVGTSRLREALRTAMAPMRKPQPRRLRMLC